MGFGYTGIDVDYTLIGTIGFSRCELERRRDRRAPRELLVRQSLDERLCSVNAGELAKNAHVRPMSLKITKARLAGLRSARRRI